MLTDYPTSACFRRTPGTTDATVLDLPLEGSHRSAGPVHSVASGHSEHLRAVYFTRRERETMRLLALGMANKEIAQELSIEVNTVKTHLKGVFRKLDVHKRKTAALVVRREGLAELS